MTLLNWKSKAFVQRSIAAMPCGDPVYAALQRGAGSLTSSPWRGIEKGLRVYRQAAAGGVEPSTVSCLEVGSGHLPIAPTLFALLGAPRVTTIDIHRRLSSKIFNEALLEMLEKETLFREVLDKHALTRRLDERLLNDLRRAKHPADIVLNRFIDYVAPYGLEHLPSQSYGFLFTIDTLEHIPSCSARGRW